MDADNRYKFELMFDLINTINKLKPTINEDKIIDLTREIYTMTDDEIENKLKSIFHIGGTI